MIHEIKVGSGDFDRMRLGLRKSMLLRDDRPFRAGDVVVLREFGESFSVYLGRAIEATITDIVRDAPGSGLMPDFALISFRYDVLRVEPRPFQKTK